MVREQRVGDSQPRHAGNGRTVCGHSESAMRSPNTRETGVVTISPRLRSMHACMHVDEYNRLAILEQLTVVCWQTGTLWLGNERVFQAHITNRDRNATRNTHAPFHTHKHTPHRPHRPRGCTRGCYPAWPHSAAVAPVPSLRFPASPPSATPRPGPARHESSSPPTSQYGIDTWNSGSTSGMSVSILPTNQCAFFRAPTTSRPQPGIVAGRTGYFKVSGGSVNRGPRFLSLTQEKLKNLVLLATIP